MQCPQFMHLNLTSQQGLPVVATVCSLLSVLSGCAVVGPASISQGRAAYNEVLHRSNEEQLVTTAIFFRARQDTRRRSAIDVLLSMLLMTK